MSRDEILPGLRCLAASPETLLVLKVLAHRVGEDEDDLRLLATELGLKAPTRFSLCRANLWRPPRRGRPLLRRRGIREVT